MSVISGDLLNQTGYIVQQCNCVTLKHHGLSFSIKKKFGKLGDVYGSRKGSKNTTTEDITPGTIQVNLVDDNVSLVHMFGQWAPGKPGVWSSRYGNVYDDDAKTRYEYFETCLVNLLEAVDGRPIYFPWRISCGLAGGDWTMYENKIQEFSSIYKGKVYIVKLT